MSGILPLSAFADDLASAVLRSNGKGIFVNGGPAVPSAAIFADDFIETQQQAIARIEATGSSINLDPETALKFQDQELILDHGSLSVFTGRGLRVRVGCVTITPVNPSIETTYEAVDRDGKVTVHASKSDVYIDVKSKNPKETKNPSHSTRDLVREGEQKSRDEKCAAPAISGHQTSAVDGLLNSPWVVGASAAAIGGVIVWVLCQDDDPISPSAPSGPSRRSRPTP